MFLRSLWAICKKDLRIWTRHPATLSLLLAPSLALLLAGTPALEATGELPVALVQLDHRPAGERLAAIIHETDVFRLRDVDPRQAQLLLARLEVVAVVTIPADFTLRVQANEPSPIQVTINNLKLDFTNDIRRAISLVITRYYERQGKANPLKIVVQEERLHSRAVGPFEYNVLPILVFLLTISGLLIGCLVTAHEREPRTMKGLLLAPISNLVVVTGKLLAGFLLTFCLGTLMFCLCSLLGWLRPEFPFWLNALLLIAMLSLFSSALGMTPGLLLPRVRSAVFFAVNLALYLFLLAGGGGVLAFEPRILQDIASFMPLAYGRHALEMAIYYNSSEQFGRDLLLVGSATMLACMMSLVAMQCSRRSLM